MARFFSFARIWKRLRSFFRGKKALFSLFFPSWSCRKTNMVHRGRKT